MAYVGGWTKFRPVTEEDFAVFNEALNGLVGVSYEPLIVATQLVNGTNYRFICNATTMTNPPSDYLAEITIFKPLEGPAVITSIKQL